MSDNRSNERILEGFRALGELRAALVGKAVSEAEVMMLLLLAVSGFDGGRLGDVANALGYSKPKASRCARKLVAYGLLTESVAKDDRRALCFKVANGGYNVVFDLQRLLGRDNVTAALDMFVFLQQGALAAYAAEERLTPTQWGVLTCLRVNERPMRAGDLAHSCALAQSTASMAVRALVQRGLVFVSPGSSGDERIRLVALTEPGKRIAEMEKRF